MTFKKLQKRLMEKVSIMIRPGYTVTGTLYGVKQESGGIAVNVNGFWHLLAR